MIVGIIGAQENDEMDYSFVVRELRNLKDIPREFDEERYRRFGVSGTVTTYWKERGFTPAYYHQFWLLQQNCEGAYEEILQLQEDLVEPITQENELIGNAIREYFEAEKNAFKWIQTDQPDYVYQLSEWYDDGSGGPLIMSCHYDDVMNRMTEEIADDIKDGRDPDRSYDIERYYVEKSDDGIKIDMEDCRGGIHFDGNGTIEYVHSIEGFYYDGLCAVGLLEPYLFLPHPFKRGDVISYDYRDEKKYAVISYAADIDISEKVLNGEHEYDGSDFTATVEVLRYKEEENRYIFGHDHICPLYFDKIETGWNMGGRDMDILHEAHLILAGEGKSLSSLSVFMG